MKSPALSVVGLGYVGLSTATCFAHRGFTVYGVEVDQDKLGSIRRGEVPFHEKGLDRMLRKSLKKKLLRCTGDYVEALQRTTITFLTVGTPSGPDGGINLTYIKSAAEAVGRVLAKKRSYHFVVVKSTVVPGTSEGLVRDSLERSSGKRCGEGFGLSVNPEFLREGSAVQDTLHPDAIVIGATEDRSRRALVSLHRKFYSRLPPIVNTTPANAELIKYASNAFRATQLSFLNTLANLCQRVAGADITEVAKGFSGVTRVDPRYLRAGLGYGGSCLPPSAKVQTINGLEPIGQIMPGEKVLAHDGQYHFVNRVFSRHFEGSLVEIRGRGFYSFPIICTPEHPVLAGKRGFRGSSRWYNNHGRRKLKNATKIHEPEFLPASQVEQGDVIYLPTPAPISPNIPVVPYAAVYQRQKLAMLESVRVTPELQYLFGIYLAEGTIWNGEIYWSLHKRELDIVEELDGITTKYFGHATSIKGRRGNGITARTTSKPLAAYLEETFGTLAWKKRIPQEWAISLPEEQLVFLVRGLIRGDGSSSSGRYEFTTTSEHLWNFVQLSLLRLRIPFSIHPTAEEIDSHGVHHRDSFTIRITDINALDHIIHNVQRIERTRKKYNVSGFRGSHFAFPVRKVSHIPYSGEVRNLEVEGANSFVLQGGTVHNCLPKDLRALIAYTKSVGSDPELLEAVLQVNEKQPLVAVEMARKLMGELRGKRVAVLGLAFKPNTDDVRESVAIKVVEELIQEGAKVTVYDPKAMENARKVLSNGVRFAKDARDCVADADCCILATEWDEFRKIKPKELKELMSKPVVVDGRRLFDLALLEENGIKFAGIGRGGDALAAIST